MIRRLFSLNLSFSLSTQLCFFSGLSLAEPAFSTIGLAHAWPSGWIQAILEVIHVHGGLPWWATIATGNARLKHWNASEPQVCQLKKS